MKRGKGVSWAALNACLLDCEDQTELRRWLGREVASHRKTRALRVYGRLSAVRRAQEVRALKERLRGSRYDTTC